MDLRLVYSSDTQNAKSLIMKGNLPNIQTELAN